MDQNIEIKFTEDGMDVSVKDGNVTLTQDVSNVVIDEVAKDFGVPRKSIIKFLSVVTAATLLSYGDDAEMQAMSQAEVMRAIRADEKWASDIFAPFTKEALPAIVEEVKKAKEMGVDPSAAISAVLGIPVNGAEGFVAMVALMDRGLSESQIVEVFIAGIKGDSAKVIAERYGLTVGDLEIS